jgi:hypothetical protein
MTAPRDPDRLIHGFLLEGEEYLQDQVYDEVRAAIEHKRQRAFFGPWRTPSMNKALTYGLAAAAVVVVLVVGAQFVGSPNGFFGADPTPTATPEATLAPTLSPTPSPPPPLTQSFTSTLHGLSLSYPEGWTARAATEPWRVGMSDPQWDSAFADILVDPVLGDHLFLAIASQPVGDSTPEDWVAEGMASVGCTATEPIVLDGASGLIGAGDCNDAVAVTTAGRGYLIDLFASPDDPAAVAAYDRAWFEEVLATVQLHPEDAVDSGP